MTAGKGPYTADVLTVTHSFQVQEEEPGGLAGAEGPGAEEAWRAGTGRAAVGDTARHRQQLIVRAGEQNKGTLSQLLGHGLI